MEQQIVKNQGKPRMFSHMAILSDPYQKKTTNKVVSARLKKLQE